MLQRPWHESNFCLQTNGIARVPLYTDGEDGLPTFLANRFAGVSRSQLLYTLLVKGFLSLEEIESALKKAEEIKMRKCGSK